MQRKIRFTKKDSKIVLLIVLLQCVASFFIGVYLRGSTDNDIFSKSPIVKVYYNIPDDPSSGFKSIEGLDPDTNSSLFQLDFLTSYETADYKLCNFRFKCKERELSLWSKYEKNGSFNMDYIGERRFSVEFKKQSSGVRKSRQIEYRLYIDGEKRVEIISEEDSICLEPALYKRVTYEIASISEELKGSDIEKVLEEFAWANTFMPENEATPLGVVAGSLFGMESLPATSSAPFGEYVRCLEEACDECGGDWGAYRWGIVGCYHRGGWNGLLTFGCYWAQTVFCLKHLPLPK